MPEHRPLDVDHAALEVGPLEPAHFASAAAGEDGQAQGHRPYRVGHGVDQRHHLGPGGHLELDVLQGRRRGPGGRVHVDPAPLDRLVERRRQDGEVAPPGGRLKVGRAGQPVVDLAGREVLEEDVTQGGPEADGDHPPVVGQRLGRPAQLRDVRHPLVKQPEHRDAGGADLGGDFDQQRLEHLAGLGDVLGRDVLGQVALLAGDRVTPHAQAQFVAASAEVVDAAVALGSPSLRHSPRIAPVHDSVHSE